MKEPMLNVEDVSEFYIRWREFRPVAMAIITQDILPRQEAEIVSWLIKIADCIEAKDLQSNSKQLDR